MNPRLALTIAIALLGMVPHAALPEDLTAARTIRARSIIAAEDVQALPEAGAGPRSGLSPADVIGQEARVTIFAGQPIRARDIGPPMLVERNQIVDLVYAKGPLLIRTEARALERGAPGDRIRAMNIASRVTVTAMVGPDGSLLAGHQPMEEIE